MASYIQSTDCATTWWSIVPQNDDHSAQNRKDNSLVAHRFLLCGKLSVPPLVVLCNCLDQILIIWISTQILDFLNSVYPTPECDQTIFVLTKLSGTSYFISMALGRFGTDISFYSWFLSLCIDRTLTTCCRRRMCKSCQPLNGSVTHLVVVENDVNGDPHDKRAFNTQVLFYISQHKSYQCSFSILTGCEHWMLLDWRVSACFE